MSRQVIRTRSSQDAQTGQEVELLVSKPLKRREDRRLLTGSSKYVDDIKLPGMLYGAVLRSTYPHARIKEMDTIQASSYPGVKLVLTARNLPAGVNSLPTEETDDGTQIIRPILAWDEIAYVGQPVAFVVATSREVAEDVLELIRVDYEALPSIVDPKQALDPSSPKAHVSLKSNVVKIVSDSKGGVEEAFRKAHKSIKVEYLNQRVAPSPIETRASLASFDSGTETLTIWLSTQGPYQIRSDICEILSLPENKVRVIAPEVGGGFGAKLSPYPEELLVAISSMQLHFPVKWVESRSENFLSMTQGRGQIQTVELAANERGRILGMRVSVVGDAGAYLTEGSSDATFTLKMSPGPYLIRAWAGEAKIVLTNKVPHDAYRGASRPEATYLIERAIDELARQLNMDPVELRLRNFIAKDDFPYETVTELEYDTGDYAMNLKRAVELFGYERWREEQKRARKEGRLLGIGLCTYVEICAFGPEFPETASITVSKTGKVTVISGTSPHGQGHESPFSQIVADELGIPLEDIWVSYGDTAQLPWGTLTAGSRSAALGGSAIQMCARKIKSKMSAIAAFALEVPESELIFRDGKISSASDTGRKSLSFSEVAALSYQPKKLPPGMEPVLYEFSAFVPKNYTFPFGSHFAAVEIEKETGRVKILDYTSVDDCGKVLNSLVVQGQIHGGITQGLGQALLEEISYAPDGNLQSASFLDYQIPQGEDVPDYHSFRTETPTDSNPLGVKGIGEAGTIAATPAIVNAVADALSPLGITVRDMPLKPDYVRALLNHQS